MTVCIIFLLIILVSDHVVYVPGLHLTAMLDVEWWKTSPRKNASFCTKNLSLMLKYNIRMLKKLKRISLK